MKLLKILLNESPKEDAECAWLEISRDARNQDVTLFKQCADCDGYNIFCELYVSRYKIRLRGKR